MMLFPFRLRRRGRPRSRVPVLWMSGWLTAFTSGPPPLGLSADIGVLASGPQATNEKCTLNSVTPDVIRVEEAGASEWHGRFDLSDLPYLWQPAEPDEVISQFRA